jgi:CheY-like chemotaxis protein
VQDEVMDAQILIVNADNTQALHLVRYAELPGRILLVGQSDGGTGWPLQLKPVKLVSVLNALDVIVGVRASAPAAKPAQANVFMATQPFQSSQLQGLDASMRLASGRLAAADHLPPVVARSGADRGSSATHPPQEEQRPMAPAVDARRRRSTDTEFPPTRPMERDELRALAVPAKRPTPSTREGTMRLTDFGGLDDLPSPPTPVPKSTRSPRSRISSDKTAVPEAARGDMLLVAESLVEGRILLKRFKRYGLNIDWSREAAQALVMLKANPYRLVVIDRLKGEPDANQICRSAKQAKGPKGAPVVIVFAPTAGSMDRMKAGLAGSDAYLSRSVSESDLYKVLAQHRLVSLDGFAPTNVGF